MHRRRLNVCMLKGGWRCCSWGWLCQFRSGSPTAKLQKDSFLINVLSEGRQCIPAAGGGDQVHYAVCTNVCLRPFLCVFLHAWMWRIKRGGKNPEIINWVLFVLPATLYDVLHNRKWKIPPMAPPRVHEPWTDDTSNPGDESAESVMSHRTDGRLLPVNLSGWPDASASVASRTSKLPPLVLTPFPPASRWIFSHSLTLKTLLTACVTARERESEENVCAVRVMWFELRATPTKLRSSANVNRHQKKNNACWWGRGGGCGEIGPRLES